MNQNSSKQKQGRIYPPPQRNWTLLFLLLICLLGASACKDPDLDQFSCKETLSPPQQFLDYWLYPEGTYWVYQNVADTSLIDTITLLEIDTVVFPSVDVEDQCETTYWASFFHSYKGWPVAGNDQAFFNLSCNPSNLDNQWFVSRDDYQGLGIPETWYAVFLETENIAIGSNLASRGNYQTPARDFFEVYEIESHFSDDVELQSMQNNPDYILTTYLSRENGIVGFILNDSGEWKLIESSTI